MRKLVIFSLMSVLVSQLVAQNSGVPYPEGYKNYDYKT